MKTHIIENNHLARNLPGIRTDFGWGNGYVLLHKEHPWHGLHYDDIPVDIHGGLTYSSEVTKDGLKRLGLEPEDEGMWMIGFDTCHLGDTLSKWTKERVQKEAERLYQQCKKL
jgi:hypothetical protein